MSVCLVHSRTDTSLPDSIDDIDKAAATTDLSTQVKRKHGDQDEDLTAGSDKGKEKKRPIKDSQPSKKSSASKESSKGKTLPKTSKPGKSVTAEEPDDEHVHEVSMDAEENIVDEMGNTEEQPDREAAPKTDNAPKNNWFKQPPRPLTPDLEWNKCQVVDDQPKQTWFNDLVSAQKDPLTFDELMATPIDFSKFVKNRLKLDKITKEVLVGPVYNLLKGTCQSDRCPFDLSKPLPLKGRPSHLTIPVEYFFNNDLEYLKSENMERKYITSIMKTKAASEDSECDRQLYTFKEGDFINLHLNDIKDMLLLVVQHKLFHLDGNVIVDLAVALRMFTRRIVIQKLVKDVQLGVESYQRKLNITKTQKDFPTISAKELYTLSFDLPGVVYEDSSNRKRLMLRNFRLRYNKGRPNRKWSAKDQRRSGMMVKLIEEQLLERRIMRNLERLVGVRELEMDYRLMQRIV
ncbi:hypothetical protein Tco_0996671 [Tanacetum coccineum]